MISFYAQQQLNKRRMEFLKYQSDAQKFTNAGGLLAKGQNIFKSFPVLYDERNHRQIEVDKTQVRLGRMRHRVWSWSQAMHTVKGQYDLYMVTLTYENIEDWKANHIRSFMLSLRKRFSYIMAYAWVAELQKRGAVHYHVMVAVKAGMPFYGYSVGYPDALGDWSHGMTKIDKARTEFYIVTYSGKEYQKMGKFPKGLRMFAVWISASVISKIVLYKFKLSAKPKWLTDIIQASQELYDEMPRLTRSSGGGWNISDYITLPSPYVLVRIQ